MCENGEEAGGPADGAAGWADGDDIRRFQVAACFRHAVGVCKNAEKAGGAADGAAGGADGDDVRGVQLAMFQTRCGRMRRYGGNRGNG